MKSILLTFSVFFISCTLYSQTSPPADNFKPVPSIQNKYVTDTINFTPYSTGTVINTQYIDDGASFSGDGGTPDPEVYDYGVGSWGAVLISHNWYDPIRIDFVDTLTGSTTNLVQSIEFDNPINTEVDYISIDVYDASNNLIHHYVSASPENVIIDFGSPSAAYMIVDDSNSTAYIIDNLLLDFGNESGVGISENNFGHNLTVSPNPSSGSVHIESSENIVEYSITNAIGEEVLGGTPNQKSINLKIDRQGVYFARLNIDGTISTRRIIISR